MTLLIEWMQPYLSLFDDPSYWMATPIPRILCTLLWMVAPIPHIHVSEILVVLVLAGLPTTTFCFGNVLIKHFTPPSLSGLMIYRAYVTQYFVIVPTIPSMVANLLSR